MLCFYLILLVSIWFYLFLSGFIYFYLFYTRHDRYSFHSNTIVIKLQFNSTEKTEKKFCGL